MEYILIKNRNEQDDRGGMRNWTDLLITSCLPKPDLQGKNIAEIAADEGKDLLETAFDLIVISEGRWSACASVNWKTKCGF